MRKALVMVVVATLAIGLLAPGAYAAGDWTGNANIFLGTKSLGNEWDPVESQAEVGIMLDFGMQEWPVNLALDYLSSSAEETTGGMDVEGATTELDIGVRKYWGDGNMRPFLGGGVSIISTEFNVVGISDCDGDATGGWIDAGILWTVGQAFNVGFDVRSSSADVELECSNGAILEGGAGGAHFGLLVGFHW